MGCFFTGTFSIIFTILGIYYDGWAGAFFGFLLGSFIDTAINRIRAKRQQQYFKSKDFTDLSTIWFNSLISGACSNKCRRRSFFSSSSS